MPAMTEIALCRTFLLESSLLTKTMGVVEVVEEDSKMWYSSDSLEVSSSTWSKKGNCYGEIILRTRLIEISCQLVT